MTLASMKADLASLKQTVADLISGKTKADAAALTDFQSKLSTLESGAVVELGRVTGELATASGSLTKISGDSTKLATGATLPTDLVSAANTISELSGKVSGLEKDKTDLTGKVTAAEGLAATKQTSIETANGKLVAFLTAAKKVPATDATLEQNAEATIQAVTSTLAAQGVKLEEIPGGDAAQPGAAAKSDILTQYAEAMDKSPMDGAQLYQKNSKAIDAANHAQIQAAAKK